MTTPNQLGPFTEPIPTAARLPLPGVKNMATKGYADGLLRRVIDKKYLIPQPIVDAEVTRFYTPEPFESGTLEVYRTTAFEPSVEVGNNAFDILTPSGIGDVFELLYTPFVGVGGAQPNKISTGIIDATVVLTAAHVRNSMYNISLPTVTDIDVTLPVLTADEDGSVVSFNMESNGSARINPGAGASIDNLPSFIQLSFQGDSITLVYVHGASRWVLVGRKDF